MLCTNGEQLTPPGETGIYFICHHPEANNGNQCKFVKWCWQTQCYMASTNKNGGNCPFYQEPKTGAL